MFLKQRAQLSRLGHEQREHRNLPDFIVNRQPEAIRKHGLHDQAHLILRGISVRFPLNIEPVCYGPDAATARGLAAALDGAAAGRRQIAGLKVGSLPKSKLVEWIDSVLAA